MRIYSYSILYYKNLSVSLSLLFSLMCVPAVLFADFGTLERLAEAERKVSYVGVRLKTVNSSRGVGTYEEMVIHQPPGVAYGMELSAVGKRKSFRGSHGDELSGSRGSDRWRERGVGRGHIREKRLEGRKWRRVRGLFSEKEIGLIAENYDLATSVSTEKIASHETDILTITPKFAGRPMHRIFFARENGVILRVETFDADDVLRAILVYTRISFDSAAVERKWQLVQGELMPEREQGYAISLSEAGKILETAPIQPAYLPPGFQLQEIHRVNNRKKTIHLIYTDGLLGFSIFETTDKPRRRSNRRREEPRVIEGTRVYTHQRGRTRTFSWSSADIRFFLFGAMPAVEMEKVVRSILQNREK